MNLRTVGIVVAVLLALVFGGAAFVVALDASHDKAATAEREADRNLRLANQNRLLFKFACALPLAVAERLDGLVVARQKSGVLSPGERPVFDRYHRDYVRGKDICPPINAEENKRIAKLLTDLGGKLPDDTPGQAD